MSARVSLLLLCLLVPVALIACGDDSDEDSASEPAARTETKPADLTDTSVKPVIAKPTGSPPRRLVKEDIVKGRGRRAKAGDTLVVNYVGVNFSTGAEFDASWDTGQPYPLPLGAGEVIEGWDKGLVGVRKGGRRMLTIPPELGYGREGAPPDIAPNETLVFVIDVVSIR